MSAFVVEDKTINGVVAFLALTRDLDRVRRVVEQEMGADLSTGDGCQQIAEAMFRLNCNAVDQRYGEGESATFRDLDYRYQRVIPPSIVQAYKSLRCWIYQCSEGDVPEASLLYSTMAKVSDALAHEIVTGLPAYDRAEWG